jgi:hypothetical protein
MRILASLILLPILLLSARAQKKTESFWDMLLRVAGVSATPGALRGTDKASSGDVWLAVVARKPVLQRLTQEGGYNSPVFDSQDKNILVLKGGDLFRLPAGGGPATKLRALSGVSKLVGLSRDDPDQLLVVVNNAQGLPSAALVSIRTGALTRLPHDPQSRNDQIMIAHLAGWERVYGDTRLYMESNEKEGAGGNVIEFSDVYVKRGADSPANLTNGNGLSSGQPSLSADGRQVVFIRGGR